MFLKSSVIICTKDRPQDLICFIESIFKQSTLPNELIIIDDGNLGIEFKEKIKKQTNEKEIKFLYTKKTVPGLALNIVLNYILIPIYGIMGAASATAISYGFILIVLFLLFKMEKMKINLNTVFISTTTIILLLDNKFIVMIFLALILFTITYNFIMDSEEKMVLNQQLRRIFKRNISN